VASTSEKYKNISRPILFELRLSPSHISYIMNVYAHAHSKTIKHYHTTTAFRLSQRC
jgi:hypothetical protein